MNADDPGAAETTPSTRHDSAEPFASVVATSTEVAASTSRRAKISALATLLSRLPPEHVARTVAYLSGIVPQGRLGVGWRTLATVPPPAPQSRLTLDAVDQAFTALAATSGPGSVGRRAELLAELFGAASADEQAFLRRLIGGELRQGAAEAVLLQAVAVAAGLPEETVRRAAMLAGSVAAVAEPALSGGAQALARIGLRVGTPVSPMLAAAAVDLPAAMAGGGMRVVERKLDGIRLQAHRIGEEVRLFTRSLDDITARLPEVVTAVAGLDCNSAVLDGEVIALRPDGTPEPFQVTGVRTASRGAGRAPRVPLTPWFFDLLHLDGTDLIDEPLHRRRAALEQVVGGADSELLVPGIRTGDEQEAARFFADTLKAGHEGVVVKDPDAPYAAGRRGSGWVKVKPRHTLDLVVLAVEWGSGRRRGWLSNIHLGARDPATGGFVMVGKTFKGMTDEMLRWQTERFNELATDRGDWVVSVRPEQVVEIALDGIQRSRRYPGGVALRFARVVRYRDDKTAAQADTIETVRSLGPPV
ncbi:MAG: ATP-dependent DNA ligase [Propionibacteriaceae bacterium]|nr:ATP-dependent DNA ligase [Propionibacteriaceae bacterium]